ncbi:MAG TPA: hypothetical protein VI011_20400 [Asanoa sp.]
MDLALSPEHEAVRPEGRVAAAAVRIRVATLYEGTSQIQQLLIGRALTGVSAF